MTDDNGKEPVKVQLATLSLQQEGIELLKKQGITYILLTAAIYFLAIWVSNKVQWVQDQVPVHIQAIKDGYKEVAQLHLDARKDADARHVEAIKEITANAKDAMDRQERVLMGKFSTQARKVEEVSKKVDSLMP